MSTTRPTKGLPPLPDPDEASFRGAHHRLMRSFDDVRAVCAWVDGPFGPVFLARTRQGVCRISFNDSEDALLEELENRAA